MLKEDFSEDSRIKKKIGTESNVVFVGSRLVGQYCAIAASCDRICRTLVKYRLVMGDNFSGEKLLWTQGGTSQKSNIKSWLLESAINDKMQKENMYRNKKENILTFNAMLLEKVFMYKTNFII